MSTGLGLQQQLASLGVELQPWPTHLEQPDASAVIAEEGRAHAAVVRRWEAQLANSAPSTRSVVYQLFDHLNRQRGLDGWDGWVAALLRDGLPAQEPDSSWPILTTPLAPSTVSAGQLFGAALAVARHGPISAVALVMGWLLMAAATSAESSSELATDLCAAVIKAALDSRPTTRFQDLLPAHELWIREVEVCARIQRLASCVVEALRGGSEAAAESLINLADQLRQEECCSTEAGSTTIGIEIWIAEANRRLQLGDIAQAYERLNDLAAQLPLATPTGADPAAWHQLKINALTQAVPGSACLTLIESKSLPRTGHHYLKRLLEASHSQGFSYCEHYQEPGCCKQSPCRAEAYWSYARERGDDHLRLVKSHDYSLDDPIYAPPPGVVRLVQVRQPLHLLVSWLELHHLQINRELLEEHGIQPSRIYLYHEKALLDTAWRLIDVAGVSATMADAKDWLDTKSNYVIAFLNKWLPQCQPFPNPYSAPVANGTYLLRYEDLDIFSPSLMTLGQRTDASQTTSTAIAYAPRQRPLLERRSTRISTLLREIQPQLADAEKHILQQTCRWQALMAYEPLALEESGG